MKSDSEIARIQGEIKGRLSYLSVIGVCTPMIGLTGTVTGPSTRAWIDAFCAKYGAKHVAYDALSASAIADAHAATHGERVGQQRV